MASEQNKAKRQAEAENAINSHVSALAEKFGVEIQTESFPIRDLEMKRLIALENVGTALGQIVETSAKFDISELKANTKPLAKMNKAELVAEAERLGVEVVPDSMTNKQIIEAIEAK